MDLEIYSKLRNSRCICFLKDFSTNRMIWHLEET